MEEQILNYRIEGFIGVGGMSRVYPGVEPMSGYKVAIKELLPRLATLDDLRAIMYEHGQGVAANRAIAKEWYQKFCNNGNTKVCDNYRRLNEEMSISLEPAAE